MKIMYAYVVADLLHIGHVIFLENAKALCDKLIVGVLTDEAAMEKKPKPVIPFEERFRLIHALKCVDLVVAQEDYSPLINVERIRPNLLVESTSHSDLEEVRRFCASRDCIVVILPYYVKQNTTWIKRKVLDECAYLGNR